MKKIMNLLKRILSNTYIQHMFILACMGCSFLILDIMLRYFSNQYVLIYRYTHASPLFFSISWIFLFLMFFYLFKKKARMILYTITCIIFNVITLAQILHMKTLNRFFGLSDLFLVSEGSDYFSFALSRIDKFTILLILSSIVCMITALITTKKVKELPRNKQYFLLIIPLGITLFTTFRYYAIERLGEKAESNGWEAAYNVKNIYIDFNNQNKNMEVAGLYEQTFRNSFLYIKASFNVEKEKINKELEAYFEKQEIDESSKNKMTGKFEDKNMIFILLESIDSWIVTEEIMPTLTKLSNDGWNFTNRYAPTFGGGQTINSEFAANTGLYAINNSKAIYNFDQNNYAYSIPTLLKNKGYTVNSIHANTAKFYNRNNFHRALGYENHYGLYDLKDIDRIYDYFLDSSLVKNEQVLNMILPENEPFMTFITTYSAHLPYSDENPNCTNLYNLDIENDKEMSCIRNLARDTDEFIRILIEKLEEKDLLEDTVLVLFSDHCMYGYSQMNKILEWKETDNFNLIQNVPFIIWNSEIKNKTITTLMDTADIVPTLLNLWNISYNPNYYIGTDVFSEKHEKFIYFSDSIFYDGELYYDGKDKQTEENQKYIEKTLDKIKEKMNINDKIILGDYFAYLKKKNEN